MECSILRDRDLMTQDGEVATYINQVIGNLTKEGNVLSRGAGFWNTPSIGEFFLLNDMTSLFKLEVDREANFGCRMGMEIEV